MRYISLFSGIEAASMAWGPLGWSPLAFSEIERFTSKVPEHHHPNVPNLGDIRNIDWREYAGKVDVVIGGSPCQDFSVAGCGKGLDGERSSLVHEFIRCIREVNPSWIVWENVRGALYTNGGHDFFAIQDALEECGYALAWRVLDAQFWDLAQRRERVFLIGHARLGCAVAVLFEPDTLSEPARSSKEKREDLAAFGGERPAYAIAANTIGRQPKNGGNGLGVQPDVSYTLTASDRHGIVVPFPSGQISSPENRSNPQPGDPCCTLTAQGDAPSVICATGYSGMTQLDDDLCGTLDASNEQPFLFKQASVRRLMPIECERLQGFPDGYTDIFDKTPDSPRYKALGNSMAVPVIEWIGRRIMEVDCLVNQTS